MSCSVLSVPPVISKNDVPGEGLAPKEVKIKVNNTLTLECEAQAIPTPSLLWYKDGQVSHTHTHTHIHRHTHTQFTLHVLYKANTHVEQYAYMSGTLQNSIAMLIHCTIHVLLHKNKRSLSLSFSLSLPVAAER